MAGKIQSRLALLAALAAMAALLVPSGLALGSHDESTDADFVDDQGVLRLQLNSSVNQFLWNDGATDHTQTLVATRCEVDTAPSNLVKLASNRKVGTFGNSLGVKSGGAQGVACSRVSSGESMTFETSGVIADYEIAEVQLDVEMKMGAEVQVQTFLDANSLETFTLRSGSSIVSGQGTEPSGQIATSTSGTPIANCRQPSDSGPDAGSLDNCRWVIKDILPFDKIVFTALAGEYSIEGGGDGTPAAAAGFGSDSLFFLTDVETLVCGATAKPFGNDDLGGDVALGCDSGFKVVRYRSSADDNQVIVTTVGDNTEGFSYTVENWHFDAQPASADPHLEYNDADPVNDPWFDAPFCLDDPREPDGPEGTVPVDLSQAYVEALFPGDHTTCIIEEMRTTVGDGDDDDDAEIVGNYLVISTGDFGRGYK